MYYKRAIRKPAAILIASISLLLPQFFPAPAAAATTGRVIRVGPTQTYKTPSAAAAAAKDGDTIEIEAGEYPGDVAFWKASKLTIRGVNGMAHLDAAGKSADGKAIWVIQGNDTTIEHIEFSGCHVSDKNGAGIRQEGKGLVVRNCSFHDNEDGILCGSNAESDILIEYTEFHHNGANDGQSHNLYINQVRKLTFQFCYSHHANAGHLLKSRAQANFILYNRFADEKDGHSSYTIDLPNGGKSFLIGNLIQHGPQAENRTAISYGNEGAKNTSQELFVVNNTYVNERTHGGTFLHTANTSTAKIINNLITGTTEVVNGPGDTANNVITDKPGFADAAHYDYSLKPSSPALHAGIDPGKAGDFSLMPLFQYHHPLNREPRPKSAKPDVGAYAVAVKN